MVYMYFDLKNVNILCAHCIQEVTWCGLNFHKNLMACAKVFLLPLQTKSAHYNVNEMFSKQLHSVTKSESMCAELHVLHVVLTCE